MEPGGDSPAPQQPNGAEPKGDPSAPQQPDASGSSSGSERCLHAAGGSLPSRSSTTTHDVAQHIDPVASPAAAHGDPTTGGQDSSAPSADPIMLEMSPAAAVEILPSGSSAAPVPATSSAPSRPAIRLSQGITRPKVHTDGTVRWCMTATTSEEPALFVTHFNSHIGLRPWIMRSKHCIRTRRGT
jgi:hypothetical protein